MPLQEALGTKPHLAVVNDALERFVAPVGGHVLLQPGLGAGALLVDLAALPEASVLEVLDMVWVLTKRMMNLKQKI